MIPNGCGHIVRIESTALLFQAKVGVGLPAWSLDRDCLVISVGVLLLLLVPWLARGRVGMGVGVGVGVGMRVRMGHLCCCISGA